MESMKDQEKVLSSILGSKLKDEEDLHIKIDLQELNTDKLGREIQSLEMQQVKLDETFMASIPENYKFKEFLTKVYMKKIKRRKYVELKKSGSDENEEEEEEEEDEDDDEEDQDLENLSLAGDLDQAFGITGITNLDVCPEGCNIALYDNAVATRENRLDLIEKMADSRKLRDIGVKELESRKKLVKQAEEEAIKAATNLDEFQIDKLNLVNEFYMVVILMMKQIEYLDEDRQALLLDMNDALVLDLSTVKRLFGRIRELREECKGQIKNIKEAKASHVMHLRLKAKTRMRIEDADEEAKVAMMKKFGRMVDLLKLENALVSPELDLIIDDYDMMRNQCMKTIADWDKQIENKKNEYMQHLKLNTAVMNHIMVYQNLSEKYATNLDRRLNTMISDDDYEGENLENLIKLTIQQMGELMELRQQMIKLFCERTTDFSYIDIDSDSQDETGNFEQACGGGDAF